MDIYIVVLVSCQKAYTDDLLELVDVIQNSF